MTIDISVRCSLVVIILNVFKTVPSRVFLILLLISIAYFITFLPINAQGAKDQYMISVFEPDEFAQYPHPIRMLDQPASSLKGSIYQFIAYQHYYYGYPFYLFSAVAALLPLKLLGLDTTQNMLLLYRQLVSILPMIAALLLLVYVQTKFRSYFRPILLYLFLLTIPVVFQNNTWWHPDSLVFFFVTLTFYFLDADNLSFRRNFYLAAIACGLAVATKLIGLFFVFAIPTYILVGWQRGKLALKGTLKPALGFVTLMVFTFVIANPFLLFRAERDAAWKIQQSQAEAVSEGFVLSYNKGPATWLPVLTEKYGGSLFLVLTALSLGSGVVNKDKRLINLLILTWALPFAFYLLFFSALKSEHYFLPVLLPIFSALPFVFDKLFPQHLWFIRENAWKLGAFALVSIIVLAQVFYNIKFDARVYSAGIRKEADSPSLQFFRQLDSEYLSKIILNRETVIYRDVRMYVADRPAWKVKHRWGTTDYAYIERTNPDVIVLWKQRLYDYTNEGALERALDSQAVGDAVRFYQDALDHQVQGYQLVYENDFGMAFVRAELYEEFLK
ncbi:MAG: hypothetical protein QM730_15660 [Anaerolineales bacterium]